MRVESWEEVVVAWYERRIVLQAGVLFVIEDALIHEPQPHPAHSKSVPPGGGSPHDRHLNWTDSGEHLCELLMCDFCRDGVNDLIFTWFESFMFKQNDDLRSPTWQQRRYLSVFSSVPVDQKDQALVWLGCHW